jgi:hypothetical protein
VLVTNVRNLNSPYWRSWLKAEWRCLVPEEMRSSRSNAHRDLEQNLPGRRLSTQIAGHAAGDPNLLDLTTFPRVTAIVFAWCRCLQVSLAL